MIERAIQDIEGVIRALKASIEERIGVVVPPKHPVLEWLIEYAADVLNRYKVGVDKKTARERSVGEHRSRPVAEFGEIVYWPPEFLDSGRVYQLEPKFKEGIWLGVDARTSEAIICTEDGAVIARSVKRRPIGEAFDSGKLLDIKYTPTNPRMPKAKDDPNALKPLDPSGEEL